MVTCEAGKYSRISVLLLAQQDCEQHHCSGRRGWCTDTGNVNTSTRSNVQHGCPSNSNSKSLQKIRLENVGSGVIDWLAGLGLNIYYMSMTVLSKQELLTTLTETDI